MNDIIISSGSGQRKVVLEFSSYTSEEAKTIDFPVPFSQQPLCLGNAGITGLVLSNSSVTIPPQDKPKSGYIYLLGIA